MNLFTKTYVKDLEWFRLAAISVLRKCKEPVKWTVAIESNDQPALLKIIEDVTLRTGVSGNFTIAPSQVMWPAVQSMNGYMAQQWVKMNLHRLPWDGNRVWCWDSDVIALKDFTEKDFMGASGRPIYWFTQYNSLMGGGNDGIFNARIATIKKIFRIDTISFEWMRCFPICVIPEILRCAEKRIEWATFRSLCEKGDRSVSEFNMYGQFACLFFPDAYEWTNTQNRETWGGSWDNPQKLICQSWSYGGIPAALRDFVERMK